MARPVEGEKSGRTINAVISDVLEIRSLRRRAEIATKICTADLAHTLWTKYYRRLGLKN